jgi:hypothetical protein
VLDEFEMRRRDWTWLVLFCALGAAALWMGH